MNFYKNVIEHKGKLLIRGVLNGKDYKEKINGRIKKNFSSLLSISKSPLSTASLTINLVFLS